MRQKIDLWAPRVLSISRIAIGLLFLQHGSSKLFGFPLQQNEGVALLSLMGVAGILEFFGGLFFLVGRFTRSVAFILSGMMAVAYLMAHATQALLPIANGGELALLYSFIFLYYAFAGGGAWSADRFCFLKKRCSTD